MIYRGEDLERQALLAVAEKICLAARTAPKAKGVDQLVIMVVTGNELDALAAEMKRLGDALDAPFFVRDSGNIKRAEAVVLLGTTLLRRGIAGCDYCGFNGCAKAEEAGARCAINLGDLSIALGSAASVAANHRADNRIMYTIGRAALNLGLLGEDVKVAYGIPLSSGGKSPFFDR